MAHIVCKVAMCYYLERCGNEATVARNGKCLCADCAARLAGYQEYSLNFEHDRHGSKLAPLYWPLRTAPNSFA